MPKQSRHENVDLGQVGASPIGHPTGMLTVETPKLPVKQLPSRQLGASPSIPTYAVVDQRKSRWSQKPRSGGSNPLGGTSPLVSCRRRPTAESMVREAM